MYLNKFKWFSMLCLIFLICFAALNSSHLAYGEIDLVLPGFGISAYRNPSGGFRNPNQSIYEKPEYQSAYYSEEDLPNIKGHWSGRWEAFKTDNNGVITEEIEQEGQIKFHIEDQVKRRSGAMLFGTIEIMGWDVFVDENGDGVNDYLDWEGETEEIYLRGWLNKSDGWLIANFPYIYYVGTDLKSDYANLISDFYWSFHISEINESETGIFGEFMVRGTYHYQLIGRFLVGKYTPD